MGTHPIFESDFDCLTVSDVKYASRIVLLFRLENPPRPRYDFYHQRWKATPSVPLFTTIKRTQESSDGLFFTEENTRRVSVKKLSSRDVSDVTSRHQKPLLAFLSLSFWPRSNKSQRSVKSNVITPSRLPRKRERPLKPTRLLPARPCQRFNLRHKPRCQRPQK